MYLSADSWPDFSTWMSLPVSTVKSIASVSGWSTPSVLPVSSTDPGTLPELTSAKRLDPHRELGRGQRFGEVEGELVVPLLQRQFGGFDLGVCRIAEHPVAFDVSGVQRSVELQDGRARVEEGEAPHPFTERSFPLDVVHEEPPGRDWAGRCPRCG